MRKTLNIENKILEKACLVHLSLEALIVLDSSKKLVFTADHLKLTFKQTG